MTVLDVRKDANALTLTITAEFDAPPDRVWELWADPRKLERWWGPPTYPATFVRHALEPGARSTYYMTSPEGKRFHGWWRILTVDAPRTFEVEDGFADDDGNVNTALPTTRMKTVLSPRDRGGTRVTITSQFGSLEAMEKLVAMGMEEGLKLAMGQMDAVLEQ